MKQSLRFFERRFYAVLLLSAIMTLALNSCFLKQDRTTVVYGTITDENGQPVDSIMVLAQGVRGFQYDRLKMCYSDLSGSYEMVVEVPKKYSSLNVTIPALPMENPKFELYEGLGVKKNGREVNACCFSGLGDRTKYDFQLRLK